MKEFNLREEVEKRRIIPFPAGPTLSLKELRSAKEDLQDAKETFARKRFKWATSQAYYAIFHSSRALLYQKKYREKSHIQLARAVKAFYIDKGLLSQEYYDNFIEAMSLREMADYKSQFSKQGAEKTIQAAERAIKLTENLLKSKK